jgi:hypothetical protein
LAEALRDLGSPNAERRKAAQAKARDAKWDALPLLLGMLSPKAETGELTRLSAVRVLATFAPWTEQTSKTVAWAAVFDKHLEVRREACAAIRTIQDDPAIKELLRYGLAKDAAIQRAAAAALRELDDMRAIAALIQAVPMPNVTANMGEPTQVFRPDITLPVGPGGARLPIFLPQGQEVSGVATEVGGPVTDLLKLIAGKDLGNLPFGWLNWYREKAGDIGAAERDQYREHRSMRERMNAP